MERLAKLPTIITPRNRYSQLNENLVLRIVNPRSSVKWTNHQKEITEKLNFFVRYNAVCSLQNSGKKEKEKKNLIVRVRYESSVFIRRSNFAPRSCSTVVSSLFSDVPPLFTGFTCNFSLTVRLDFWNGYGCMDSMLCHSSHWLMTFRTSGSRSP